jgi:hypothetical protein
MEVQEYLATLCVRQAELKGLKFLPGPSKDALTPVLLLAPWLNTSPLTRAIDKFEDSYPRRPYFVDVDTYYQVSHNGTEAKAQWIQISQVPANLEIWWSLLEQYPNAHPCIQMVGQPIELARAQIIWAREHLRTFCLRFDFANANRRALPDWLTQFLLELVDEGVNDFAVILDFGLVEDPLSMAATATGFITHTLSELNPDIPIAISCTSFPSDFTVFDGLSECAFTNRELVNQVRQSTNRPRIVYGDWGSTKPRMYGHASPPKHRIDYPVDDAWAIARGQDEEISLQTAAEMIVGSQYWDGTLGVWGEQMIEDTAEEEESAINSMHKMYAARINIHLHRQAFYDHLPAPEALDEEWNDDDL